MRKKIMKRSLALGALMAFVITGSAWAADVAGTMDTVGGRTIYKGYTTETNHGGVLNKTGNVPKLENYDFIQNTAKKAWGKNKGKGGAIYISSGTLSVEDSAFYSNTSGEKGGAICINATNLSLNGTLEFREF